MNLPCLKGLRRLAPLALLLVAGGCESELPPPADPAAALRVLESALSAWKSGGTPDQLAAQEPPIRVLDRDWSEGAKLVDFKVDGQGQPLGLNLQCPVTLNLQDKAGKAATKNVVYMIGMSEPIVISRQDGDF